MLFLPVLYCLLHLVRDALCQLYKLESGRSLLYFKLLSEVCNSADSTSICLLLTTQIECRTPFDGQMYHVLASLMVCLACCVQQASAR